MPTAETPEEIGNLEQAFTDAAAQVPEVAPTPQPAEPTQQEPSAAFRAAQTSGFDTTGFNSDEELVQGLYAKLAESQPYAEYARQVLPYDQDLRQMIAARNQPQAPATQTKPPEEEWSPGTHFKKVWKTPDYDKGWEAFINSGMVTVDQESGQFVAVPKYANSVPINVLQGLNGRRTWQREALEKLIENPYESTWQAFQEPLERVIQQKVAEHIKSYDSVQAVNAWEHANEKVLYEHDPQGQIVYDIYGNMKPTPYGEVFIQSAREARQKFPGISHEDVIKYATAVATPYRAAQEPTQPEPVAQQPAAVMKEKSFLQKAMQKAGHSPNSGGYAEANDLEPVVMDSRDLESMFATAAKKAGVR
jgi:hypothetical protein